MTGAASIAALYAAIQTDWFGLAPGTASNLVVQATWVALAGWWSLRVAARGCAAGLFLAPFVLFLDQMTAVLGVPRATVALPDDYWIANTLRVAAVLALYPLGVRLIAARLPRGIQLAAVPLALLPLPFLRFYDAPALVLDALRHGVGGIILPIPWPALTLVATLLTFVADRLSTTGKRGVRWLPLALATLLITAGVPGVAAARDAYLRNTSVLLTPRSGGPLDLVQIQATVSASSVRVTWDDTDVVDATGAPVVVSVRGGAVTVLALPALQSTGLATGAHGIAVRAGERTRVADFVLAPAGGLRVTVADRHIVVEGGAPGGALALLVLGARGPEQLSVHLSSSGTWTSDAELPSGDFRIVAQSGTRWALLETSSR